jgi:cytochrome P450
VTANTETEPADGWNEFQYDHRDPRVIASPYDIWRRMRADRPVIHSDRYGGFWFVSRYDDVKRVCKDWRNFTSTTGVAIPRMPIVMYPGEVDPPVHGKHRNLINHLLAKEVVSKHEPWIRDLVRYRISRLEEGVEFDTCKDLAEPFAKRVALKVIGYPEQDLDKLDRWTTTLAYSARDDEESEKASGELFAYFTETLLRRAEEGPSGDIISSLVFGEIDGRRLTLDEQRGNLLEISFGGLGTTGAVFAGALVWLAGHPEDRVRLRDNPDMIPTAVEEFVRYISPVTQMGRGAAEDVTLGGCPIPKGDRMLIGYASANRDETVFENPDDVVLDRSPNPHLGFGFGPHHCVGFNLGALAVRIGLEEFLTTFDSFEVTDYYALRWSGGEGRGLTAAPMKVRRA